VGWRWNASREVGLMKIIRPIIVVDSVLTSSNVPETDYPAYAAGTTYALGNRVIVIGTNIHKIYESLQASNTGHDPASSPTWWLDCGATNRWKMFDQSVTSQTSNPDSIANVYTPGTRVDSVAILNVDAASARIVMQDATDGTVYDQTFGLISDSDIQDWYAYFFEPIKRIQNLAITDMPPYGTATLSITLSNTGSTVKCGATVLGLSKDIGGTQYGAKVGIQDYSIKQQDAFGNYTILQRNFRKIADFSVWVENTLIDTLQSLLAEFRAVPVVYIGSDQYESTIIYGFYKDFSISIAYPTVSICSIQLEGLT
jgi:hypothetical protein